MVIKMANDFISFQFGDIQFLDIMKFLGGATSLGSFLKAYKANELKKFFPYEWFDSANELENEELPPTKPFSVNWETTTLLIETFRIIKSWGQVDLMSRKY